MNFLSSSLISGTYFYSQIIPYFGELNFVLIIDTNLFYLIYNIRSRVQTVWCVGWRHYSGGRHCGRSCWYFASAFVNGSQCGSASFIGADLGKQREVLTYD